MRVVIAMDSFKGSLSSLEAGNAVAQGTRLADKQADVVVMPIADGGEGTVEALINGMNGTLHESMVTGPLGKPVNCKYGILNESGTAIIEMSGAAGITLISANIRNPFYTTTYGVGEVIKASIFKGCRRFIVGIGGSATNDGGIGMLQALGFEFLDKNGHQIPFGAKGIEILHSIENKHVIKELKDCSFRIACDVTNPLYGENGCSTVFGPQKGADDEMAMEKETAKNNLIQTAQQVFRLIVRKE